MKKLSFVLAIILGALLVACTNDEFQGISSPEESNVRTVNDAIKIALDAYGDLYGDNASRGGVSVTVDNVKTFSDGHQSRSGTDESSMYVVNFDDNKGFAVVTANKECTPVLAVAESGEITDIDSIDNPGLKAFMKGAMAYSSVKPIFDDGREIITPIPMPPTIIDVVDTIYENIEPKVTTNFGQQWPEGYFCPNKLCGCVVTAATEALSYYGLPSYIEVHYESHTPYKEFVPWVSYKEGYLHSLSYYPDINQIDTVRLTHYYEMARFCRELGYKINADYHTPNGTGARISDLQPVLKKMVPQVNFSDVVYSNVTESVIKGNDIIIMAGYSSMDENGRCSGGHAWVIDGYKAEIHHIREYWLYRPLLDGVEFKPSGTPKYEYNKTHYSLAHINWGWNGADNGYYDVGVYDLTKCKEYDDEFNRTFSASNFQYNVHYFTLNKN